MRLYIKNGELTLDPQGERVRLKQGTRGCALRVKLDHAFRGVTWRAQFRSGDFFAVEYVEPGSDGVTMLVPVKPECIQDTGTLYFSMAAITAKGNEGRSNSVGIEVITDPLAMPGLPGSCGGHPHPHHPHEPFLALEGRVVRAMDAAESARDEAVAAAEDARDATKIEIDVSGAVLAAQEEIDGFAENAKEAVDIACDAAVEDVEKAKDIAAAVTSYLDNHDVIMMDNRPVSGSRNAITSGAVFDALAGVMSALLTGENYVPLGSSMICYGTFQISSVEMTNAVGGVSYGDAAIGGKADAFATIGGFPACFTGTPRVWAFPTGATSHMWVGRSLGDAGGLKNIEIMRGESATKTFSGGYIAIGRIDGARAGGAAVITQALKYLGQTGIGNELIDAYNEIAPDNRQEHGSAWCSELASVSANRAGIGTDIFPYFASAVKGAGKFSKLGKFYKLSGTKFVKAEVTNDSSSGFAFVMGDEVYSPRLGDVLWTSSEEDQSFPNHTALIVSVTNNSDGTTSIYTIEGNVDDGVRRLCRTIGLGDNGEARDKNIYAVGRVDYPSGYDYLGMAAWSSDDGKGNISIGTGVTDDGNGNVGVGGAEPGSDSGSDNNEDKPVLPPYDEGTVVMVDGLTAMISNEVIVVSGATAELDTNGVLVISGGSGSDSGSGSESGGDSGDAEGEGKVTITAQPASVTIEDGTAAEISCEVTAESAVTAVCYVVSASGVTTTYTPETYTPTAGGYGFRVSTASLNQDTLGGSQVYFVITDETGTTAETTKATIQLAAEPYVEGDVVTISDATATFSDEVITIEGKTATIDSDGILTVSSGSGSGSESGGSETTMYTVTKNLANCQISNDVASVAAGAAYSATITANEGYTLSDVTCTMGGVQQTVTNGAINISNVTGDIVITASAAQAGFTYEVEQLRWDEYRTQIVAKWSGANVTVVRKHTANSYSDRTVSAEDSNYASWIEEDIGSSFSIVFETTEFGTIESETYTVVKVEKPTATLDDGAGHIDATGRVSDDSGGNIYIGLGFSGGDLGTGEVEITEGV